MVGRLMGPPVSDVLSPRDADRDTDVGIPAVIHVVAAVFVIDVHIVVIVPVAGPILRPGIEESDPVTLVLEAWISVVDHEWLARDPERMLRAEIAAVAIFRNPV